MLSQAGIGGVELYGQHLSAEMNRSEFIQRQRDRKDYRHLHSGLNTGFWNFGEKPRLIIIFRKLWAEHTTITANFARIFNVGTLFNRTLPENLAYNTGG